MQALKTASASGSPALVPYVVSATTSSGLPCVVVQLPERAVVIARITATGVFATAWVESIGTERDVAVGRGHVDEEDGARDRRGIGVLDGIVGR